MLPMYVRPKALISAEAKKSPIKDVSIVYSIFSQVCMIGFVTWPPFLYQNYYKGGQVTNQIILVKICYKLLYIIQVI